MKKIKENKIVTFNFKPQKLLYAPNFKSFINTIFDIEKNKKRILYSNYKKFLRLKTYKRTMNKDFLKKNQKALIKEKIQLLNCKLTKKNTINLQLLNDNFFYTNLKATKLKSGYLKGYSAYSDKIFVAKS